MFYAEWAWNTQWTRSGVGCCAVMGLSGWLLIGFRKKKKKTAFNSKIISIIALCLVSNLVDMIWIHPSLFHLQSQREMRQNLSHSSERNADRCDSCRMKCVRPAPGSLPRFGHQSACFNICAPPPLCRVFSVFSISVYSSQIQSIRFHGGPGSGECVCRSSYIIHIQQVWTGFKPFGRAPVTHPLTRLCTFPFGSHFQIPLLSPTRSFLLLPPPPPLPKNHCTSSLIRTGCECIEHFIDWTGCSGESACVWFPGKGQQQQIQCVP